MGFDANLVIQCFISVAKTIYKRFQCDKKYRLIEAI